MKIIFLGTPELAVPSLKKIMESSHELTAVITQPDKKSGRGQNVLFSPVKQVAVEAGIPVFQPESVKEESFMEELESIKPDLFVAVAYAQKIPDRILNMAPFGCINLHPSLLPKYRGAVPTRGPILNGDEYTGVSIITLNGDWDAGDILAQVRVPMDKKETCASLEEKLSHKGAEILLEVIEKLEKGNVVPMKQEEGEHTYYRQITKEEGRIDFSKGAVRIERQIRACIPWPSAFTTLSGKTFKIWDADVVSDEELKQAEERTGSTENLPLGSAAYIDKKNLWIKTSSALLKLNEVQMEGKKRMNIEEFLRGRKINRGDIFGE